MKIIFNAIVATLIILLIGYFGSFLITPSVTINNASSMVLHSSIVTLPNSNLDFGSIEPSGSNTIHYSLTQAKGEYEYQFVLGNNLIIEGKCGQVKNQEISKRVIIVVKQNQVICCSENC